MHYILHNYIKLACVYPDLKWIRNYKYGINTYTAKLICAQPSQLEPKCSKENLYN